MGDFAATSSTSRNKMITVQAAQSGQSAILTLHEA